MQIPIGIHDEEQQILSSDNDHNLSILKSTDFLRHKIRQQRQKMKIHYLSSNTRAMDDGTSKRLYPMWNLSVVHALNLGSKRKGLFVHNMCDIINIHKSIHIDYLEYCACINE